MRGAGWAVVVLLSTGLVCGLSVADVDGPVRLAAALWFLLVCPGMAFAPLLPAVAPPARLGLGIALSLALDTAVATAMLAAGSFSAPAGLLALGVACVAGAGLQIRRALRTRPVTRVRVRAAGRAP